MRFLKSRFSDGAQTLFPWLLLAVCAVGIFLTFYKGGV